LLHKWGFSPKVPRKRFVNTASNKEKKEFKKKAKEIISYIPKDFTVAVEDESIFIHDALIRRRMWTPEGIRPIVTVTGSHQRTCVFGTITIDGKQLFRQYDVFNQYVFLKYLKELQRKFRKLLLFIDRAVQHRSSIMVRNRTRRFKLDITKVSELMLLSVSLRLNLAYR
jgi:hypothetical protein